MAKKNLLAKICRLAQNGQFQTKMTVNQCSAYALFADGFALSVPRGSVEAFREGKRVEVIISWTEATAGVALDCRKDASKYEKASKYAEVDKILSKKRRPGRKPEPQDEPDDEETVYFEEIAERYPMYDVSSEEDEDFTGIDVEAFYTALEAEEDARYAADDSDAV